MDARSIAATAANKGYLTAATDMDTEYTKPAYHFDKTIYENRVFDSKGVADPCVEIQFGPNIKDWPQMSALPQNMVLKVVSEIHDPVTTTDELIPSGRDFILSVRTHLDWQSLHYPEKILLMLEMQKKYRKHRKQLKKATVR